MTGIGGQVTIGDPAVPIVVDGGGEKETCTMGSSFSVRVIVLHRD